MSVFSSLDNALGAPASEFLKVWEVPKRFAALAFKRRVVADQLAHNAKVSEHAMKKQLTWFSFACMGTGQIIATGIFSFMPFIYASITGPAVVISLLIASVTAALSALLYSEFAVEYPVVGGGFVYVLNVFGEFPAILCAVNLMMDYIFGTSAVIRNFSVYVSQLFNQDHNLFQKTVSFQTDQVDYLALLVVILLTIIALFSMRIFDEGNIGLQFLHIGLVVFTFVAAFTKAETANWKPFFPPDLGSGRTVITGASLVFFVFIGYDVIALGAEEAVLPTSVPIGMISCVIFVTIIYELMAMSLVMLIPYSELAAQPSYAQISGFAYAFTVRGMSWAKYVVALGACVGIFTSTGLGVYGIARILTVFAREGMIPAFIGYVHPRFATPVIATICAGIISGLMAFFTGFNTLANMTSIGTLTMYWFVAVAHIFRRYCPDFETQETSGNRHLNIKFRPDPLKNILTKFQKTLLLYFYLVILTAAPIGFTIYWNLQQDKNTWLWILAIVWFVFTLALQLTLPIEYAPKGFAVPSWMLPWAPSASIWCNVMLVGGFGATKADYVRLFVAMGIGCVIYLVYGVHASYYRFYGPSEKPGEGPTVDAAEIKEMQAEKETSAENLKTLPTAVEA